MFRELTIVINDPDLVQIICNKEFTKFPDRRPFILGDKIFDTMLFSTSGEQWKRLRAVMSPTFSAGKLRKIKYIIDKTVTSMINNFENKLKNDNNVNIKELVGAFTMDTIIQMAYGVEIDSLNDPNNLILKNARKIFSRDSSFSEILFFSLATISPTLVKYSGFKWQKESISYFEKCSIDIIKKKREELKNKTSEHRASNFIELILECEDEQINKIEKDVSTKDFKHISNDEILAQCIVFFTVGYDTTATTIANICYMLASNPEKQEKLYDDIKETLKQLSKESNNNEKDAFQLITFDTLNRFQYLTAFINETMRFMTLATATERLALEDVHIKTEDQKFDFHIKKGDIIRIPIINLHHDPNNFSEPDQFLPERFLNSELKFNKSAFMPFGSGPRNCLAKSLALLEAKMAIVHLVRLYQFKLDDTSKNPIDFYIQFDLLITKDFKLKIEKRQDIKNLI